MLAIKAFMYGCLLALIGPMRVTFGAIGGDYRAHFEGEAVAGLPD